MKIYSSKQLLAANRHTIKKEGISSFHVMERAATLVFEDIHDALKGSPIPIKLFCGIGNNGGDGLILARLLLITGYKVQVFIVNYSQNRSKDFLFSYDRIKSMTKQWPVLLKEGDDFPQVTDQDLVIDAIIGIGLNRPLDKWVGGLIEHINKSGRYVVSIDIPSGMFVDIPTPDEAPVIQADYTITLHSPKLPFFFPNTGSRVGNLLVLDIGLDPEYLDSVTPLAELVKKSDAKQLYKSRKRFSHKKTYGHACLVGGSYGKMGSIGLSAQACLRSGAGVVSIAIPQCGYDIIQTLVPEAMVTTGKGERFLEDIDLDFEPEAICFGPGAGQNEQTRAVLELLLKGTQKPMVIDADGLNLLAKNPELLSLIPSGSILTPHPKELLRLIGEWTDDFDKLEKARVFSKKFGVQLVLKDAYTFVILGDEVYVNTTGNAGMATAGSGDVLSGIITALLAQGYDPGSAAKLGVYLHGKAGDIAAQHYGEEAMIAGDIVAYLGDAFLDFDRLDNYKKLLVSD